MDFMRSIYPLYSTGSLTGQNCMSANHDPHKAREALKYEKPVVSREFIAQALKEAKEPMTLEHLAEQLGYTDGTDEYEGLRRRMGAMQRDGQIIANRRGGYMPVDEDSLVAGRIQAHADGYGFVISDDSDDDVYLNGKQMRQVLHGDRVVVSITGTDRRGRREGRIIQVVEHVHHTLVGRFMDDQGVMHVSPDNKRIHLDIMIPVAGRNHAQEGDIVVVELTEQPTRRHPPVGKVIEVLGPELKAGMEIDVALRSHDIPYVWPDAVTAEADDLGTAVSGDDIPGRKDIRKLPLMTIDGADARDFDDAVFAEKTAKGYRLLVAIADVANYVKPGSALDAEATHRGTSVYFPGQVVPMLPEVLSNGLCSLNPHVDRLCMLCELSLDEAGGIKRTRFYNAVMQSHARLTYDKAWEILSQPDSPLREEFSHVLTGLETLYELYTVLRAARDKRGVIEFESNETRIVFDRNRKIEKLLPVVRNDAHKLIEECMILANIAAAAFVERQAIPALYRVHQGPKSDRLDDLRSFLAFRGLTLGGGDAPAPVDYARLSKAIENRADRSVIETTMLRSMQQAVYQPKNEGHFGLALTQYAHFTSPIRRYPDLLVHRAIKYALTRKSVEQYHYSTSDMQALGVSCSSTERRAEEASRDVLSWLKCEYMQSHVGDEFDGVVATVTSFGLFVELNDLHVEGLVHITSLVKDYYRFDPAEGALTGEKTGRQYRLGESIRVRVAAVNLDDRKIDFQEVDTGPRKANKPRRAAALDPTVRQKKPKKPKSQLRRDKQRLKIKAEKQAEQRSQSKQDTPKSTPPRAKTDNRKSTQPVKTEAQQKRAEWKNNRSQETTEPRTGTKQPNVWKTASTKSDAAKQRVAKKSASKKRVSKATASAKPLAEPSAELSAELSPEPYLNTRSSKKVVAKKAASKKVVSKKTISKKAASKKAVTKKPVSKKSGTKKITARKVSAKKTSAKKVVAKGNTAKKVAAKKAAKKVAKKRSSKKAVTKKTASKKTTGKKPVAKKRAKKRS